MAIQLNKTALAETLAHELSEIGGLCDQARCVIGKTQNLFGKPVQIQMVVTCDESEFIYVEENHPFPITVEE